MRLVAGKRKIEKYPHRIAAVVALALVLTGIVAAQTVNIKFRYQPQAAYVRVHFPGQFNNWGPNSGGTITGGTPSQADSLESSSGLWVKTVPISFGTWQYKIYRQLSASPTDWSWIPDPLNRVVISPDQNSQFVVDSLVLFQISAYPYTLNGSGVGPQFVVFSSRPNLSAGVFQPAGAPGVRIDALLDSQPIPNALNYYDGTSGIFAYKPALPIADGPHTFTLIISAGGQSRADSVTFLIHGTTAVQIQTPSFTTHKTLYITSGVVYKPDGSAPDSTITTATIAVNGVVRAIPVVNATFLDSTALGEGANRIRVSTPSGADSIVVTRIVNHTPYARATTPFATGTFVQLSAASSTDPDGQPLTFTWFDDPRTPLGLTGKTGSSASVSRPGLPGDYFFGLIAADPDGNADTTRSWFTIKRDGSFVGATIARNPEWARAARVYFLFPKAVTQAGTINAAAQRLQYIKDLGFNVIWVMPVMKNASPIDQNFGPGYNIVDFYNVAPEYGTNNDFRNFISQAHALGLKVILDVTPNHTSRFHPWSVDAHTNHTKSPYWNWYEHTIIPHNDNGLGQSLDADGFNYYSGFSNQLLNFNWRDVDAQAEMINVYKYWITQFGLDGYRFDVYWGPHRRYGEQYMGNPVRDALKHIKPDLLLLGEDDGTGSGTQTIYADYVSNGINSGLDAAYDFKLYFNQIRGFGFSSTAISSLHNEIDNGGYYPGPNALYMRFMESQDEDRIVYFYSNSFAIDALTTFHRTMPMASVIFTSPGFPMLWNGQEVGWGYGITGAKERRNRSTIDWNYRGKDLLSPHYQKLAFIRGEFPAFTQHKDDTNADGQVTSADIPDFVRVNSSNNVVYAFTRPYVGQNGLTVVNFSEGDQSTTLDLTGTNALKFTGGIQTGAQYYLNNLYSNSHVQVAGSTLNAVPVSLPAYGTAIFTVSTTLDTLHIEHAIVSVNDRQPIPLVFDVAQNYPNPFNPTTTIRFQVPQLSSINLTIYDVLGRTVATLIDAEMTAGNHEVVWDGRNSNGVPVAGGVYLYRFTANGGPGQGAALTRKLVLLK